VVNSRRDPLDVDLVDRELLSEVNLLVQLMAAARDASTPLDRVAIDALLFREEAQRAADAPLAQN
jgi:hypothetical protein